MDTGASLLLIVLTIITCWAIAFQRARERASPSRSQAQRRRSQRDVLEEGLMQKLTPTGRHR